MRRVLIANRGEIASRITRTLRRLGIEAVAVYTDPDAGAAHVLDADRAVAIGPAAAYLSVEAIIEAARTSGASAVHPGYGFLSESPALAVACEAAGLVWIGPPASAIEAMGDKINAKRTVAAAGVPVVPGAGRPGLTDEQLGAAALEVGLPVLLKPSAGGGGKGMRRVDQAGELTDAIAAARREARAAFRDDTLLVERYVTRPRHIEVQVFADQHGHVIHLGERECSLQRRHQKIVEEAPSPLLTPAARASIGAAAVAVARSCGYVGAGTVEFIVSADRPDEFFFMEMNTRLQVEHPVTEEVTGFDLVEWQVRVAAGEPLPVAQAAVRWSGHAVEARVYAEDADRGFLPATGPVRLLSFPDPEGGDVRVDAGLRAGTVVGTSYDPMLAKVIARGPDRETAVARLRAALGSTTVLGVTTNVGFLRRLLGLPEVVAGDLDTELVERRAEALAAPATPPEVVATAALLALAVPQDSGAGRDPSGAGDPWAARGPADAADPWDRVDGWRVGGPAWTSTVVRIGGARWTVRYCGPPAAASVRIDDGPATETAIRVDGSTVAVSWAGVRRTLSWAVDGSSLWLGGDGDTWVAHLGAEAERRGGRAHEGAGPVTSPMPGTVLAVHVAPGEAVHAGQPLVTVEAMKMEYTVRAPVDGVVAEVQVEAGQSVTLDQLLADVRAPDEEVRVADDGRAVGAVEQERSAGDGAQ